MASSKKPKTPKKPARRSSQAKARKNKPSKGTQQQRDRALAERNLAAQQRRDATASRGYIPTNYGPTTLAPATRVVPTRGGFEIVEVEGIKIPSIHHGQTGPTIPVSPTVVKAYTKASGVATRNKVASAVLYPWGPKSVGYPEKKAGTKKRSLPKAPAKKAPVKKAAAKKAPAKRAPAKKAPARKRSAKRKKK